jgi:hypothetical protein
MAGYKPPGAVFTIGMPVPGTQVQVGPVSILVSTPGGDGGYQIPISPQARDFVFERRGILLIVTQAVNPENFGENGLSITLASPHTVCGWIPLYER